MARGILLLLPLLLLLLLILSLAGAKTLDPYKVLGVDKSASQRDIQKAFHKLSLQYHPDKNKGKGAQEKFAEINNAYEILSDEDKRKNYDLYGDEKGNPGFDAGNSNVGNFGNREGYTYFTTGGPGSGQFGSSSGGWQNMGGQGETKSFSFSFSGDPRTGGNPFGFSFGDMFSDLFSGGTKGGSQFGGFSGSSGPNSRFASSVNIEDVNVQLFNSQIKDHGFTWLLLFYTPSAKGHHMFESIIEDVAILLDGAVKAGRINCLNEQAFCNDLGVTPTRTARLFIYSYKNSERGSLIEYSGDFDARNLKSFCQDHLPRFSKRVDLGQFDFSSSSKGNLPEVLLLSTKKDTPVMWRVVSGLYRKRFIFYDAQVHDASHPMLKRLGVDALPAVIGRLVDGKEHVLRTGIAVKDLKSGVRELSALLESFEGKNRKAASNQSKKPSHAESPAEGVPYLSASNFDSVCSDKATVCMIGVFRSSKAKVKLETILSAVSQKTFVRQQFQAQRSTDSISYSLLDAAKQSSFLYAFDKYGYKSSDKLLVAYKPRKGRFAVLAGEMNMEEVEKFISSALNGDVRFSPVRQKPLLR